jgi:hypothetical protein
MKAWPFIGRQEVMQLGVSEFLGCISILVLSHTSFRAHCRKLVDESL